MFKRKRNSKDRTKGSYKKKFKPYYKKNILASYGSILGVENKYFDTEYANQPILATVVGSESSPATYKSLNSISQGDGETQRDGKKVRLTSMYIRGMVFVADQNDLAIGSKGTTVRLLVVQDRQTNGDQLNAEDVLKDPTSTYTDAFAHINLKYSKRFKILHDQTVDLFPPTLSYDGTNMEAGGMNSSFQIYKKLNIDVNYSGTGGTVSDIVDNSIQIIAIGTQVYGGALALSYNARVRFVG